MLSALPVAYAFLPVKDFDKDGTIAALAENLSIPDVLTLKLQKEWIKNDNVPFLE